MWRRQRIHYHLTEEEEGEGKEEKEEEEEEKEEMVYFGDEVETRNSSISNSINGWSVMMVM